MIDIESPTVVPSTWQQLYQSFAFLVALYMVGDVLCQRCLRVVPSCVGHIVVGLALGPAAADWVPQPPAWVLWGNIGLVLLLLQAGLEIDLDILKKAGLRGVVVAVVGSILPIGLGMLLSSQVLGDTVGTAVAVGCSFGPTSAAIAMNVLGPALLAKPVGQLIVAAAIVDDIIALVILSLLRALSHSTIDVKDFVIPIVWSSLWLGLGGALALFAIPHLLDQAYKTWQKIRPEKLLDFCGLACSDETQERVVFLSVVLWAFFLALWALFVVLSELVYRGLGARPWWYINAFPPLLGAFLTGLCFCRQAALVEEFQRQLKHIVQWLMRLFFAATVGFQVPVNLFGSVTIIRNGIILSLSLLGKLLVGPLLTPVFDRQAKCCGGAHIRDMAVVGFSMAGEAEFAFVVAVFGLAEFHISPERYVSVIWAILLSTVMSPLAVKTTLALFPYKDDREQELDVNDVVTIKVELPGLSEMDGTDTENETSHVTAKQIYSV